MYRHTERLDSLVWFYAAALTVVLLLKLVGGVVTDLLPVLLLLGAAVFLMSRMNTEVIDGQFKVSFGPGLLPARVPVQAIMGLERVELTALDGYGLRLALADGSALIIVSDDLDGLEGALSWG